MRPRSQYLIFISKDMNEEAIIYGFVFLRDNFTLKQNTGKYTSLLRGISRDVFTV